MKAHLLLVFFFSKDDGNNQEPSRSSRLEMCCVRKRNFPAFFLLLFSPSGRIVFICFGERRNGIYWLISLFFYMVYIISLLRRALLLASVCCSRCRSYTSDERRCKSLKGKSSGSARVAKAHRHTRIPMRTRTKHPPSGSSSSLPHCTPSPSITHKTRLTYNTNASSSSSGRITFSLRRLGVFFLLFLLFFVGALR